MMRQSARGESKMPWIALVATAIASLLAFPAYSQSFKKGTKSGAQTESRPQIDEKAYKDALDRIPTPKKGYDPWARCVLRSPPRRTSPTRPPEPSLRRA
jgi:hypothetical protein